jgi:ABC-type multidrug transport system fused ATPase/permease subunit
MLVVGFFELIGLSLFIPIIDSLQNSNENSKIIIFFDKIFLSLNINPELISYLFLLCILFIAKAVITLFVRHLSVSFAADMQALMRTKIFDGLINSQINFINEQKQGSLISAINDHTLRAAQTLFILLSLTLYIVTVIIYLIFASFISWQLTIIAILISLLIAPILKLIGDKANNAGKLVIAAIEKGQQIALETLQAKKLINSMNWGKDRIKKYNNFSIEYTKAWHGTVFWSNSSGIIFQPISIIILSILILLSIKFNMSISLLGAFILSFVRLLPAIQISIVTNTDFKANLPSFKKVKAMLDKLPTVKEHSGSTDFIKIKNNIELTNIKYSYDKKLPILDGLNLTIKSGKTTALVGPSGMGKSTIADLILGLQIPNSGKVTIDGLNLNKINLLKYRDKISYIVQDPFLFNDTIRNNLLVGIESEVGNSELIEFCKQSNSWDFINKKPMGLDTIIGDRGVELSGGQRQRICLTRALIRKPQILILDEATSSLDKESEASIKNKLIELGKTNNYTIIIIAHRYSTIKHSDYIYQIKDGKAENLGNWNDAKAILEKSR